MWHLTRVSDGECVLSTTDREYLCEEFLEYIREGIPVDFEYEEKVVGKVH